MAKQGRWVALLWGAALVASACLGDDDAGQGAAGAAGAAGSQSAGAGTTGGGDEAGSGGAGSSSTGVGGPGSGGAAGSGSSDGGACTGACAPGSTCTLDPPPGSRVPSVLCTCTDEGAWCCGDPSCLEDQGGAGTTGGAGGTGGSAGAAGSAGDGTCAEDCESRGFACCDGKCVNLGNDIFNCGGCGVTCDGPDAYCNGTACGAAPCGGCAAGQLCCSVNIGPSVTQCTEPVDGTCPMGCPFCDCASAQTRVATPSGEVPITDLREGDLVYSVLGDAVVVAPVRRIHRVAVQNHRMVRVQVDSGRTVLMSPRHPTSTFVRFDALEPGDVLGLDRVVSVELVPYDEPFTYDILPGTPSGAYFADGVLVGSTLPQ